MLEFKTDTPASGEYEQDQVLWYQHQIELLRGRRFDQVDVDNLIEELRYAMNKERRKLGSRLEILIMHLLNCQFQHHRISAGWLGTLDQQRNRIADLLEDSPSLVSTVAEVVEKVYPRAVRAAARESRLPEASFPASNPYSQQLLLDHGFIP